MRVPSGVLIPDSPSPDSGCGVLGCGCLFVILVLGVAAEVGDWAVSSLKGSVSPRAVVQGVTPRDLTVGAGYLYTLACDGACRETTIDNDGTTHTVEYSADGKCIYGCEAPPRKLSYAMTVQIRASNPKRQVHFTLRECLVRKKLFSNSVCD